MKMSYVVVQQRRGRKDINKDKEKRTGRTKGRGTPTTRCETSLKDFSLSRKFRGSKAIIDYLK